MQRALFLFLLAFLGAAASKKGDSRFRVSAYVPEYRFGSIELNQAGLFLSDVILFSVEASEDGGLTGLDRIEKSKIEKVKFAKANMGFNLFIAIGGGGRSLGLSQVVKSGARREKLVGELVALCEAQGFNGVVLDMEVNFAADMAFLPGLRMIAKMIKEKNKKLIVSMAVHPGQERLFQQSLVKAIDRFHLMAYDYCPDGPAKACRHSTLEHAKDVLSEAIKIIPAAKIELGIPAYGRVMDKPDEALTYKEITDKYGEFPPDVDESNGVYFNGRLTVAKKVELAEELGIGGVFFWEAGQDLDASHKSSLIRAAGIERDRINEGRNKFKKAKAAKPGGAEL